MYVPFRYVYLFLPSIALLACAPSLKVQRAVESFSTQNIDDFSDIQVQKNDLCQINSTANLGKVYEYHYIKCKSGASGYITKEYFQYFKDIK